MTGSRRWQPLLVLPLLSGCVIGLDGPVTYETEQGFQNRTSYVESGTNQPARYVSIVRNVGEPAESVAFRVTLREDGKVVWVGSAVAEDVQTGEDVIVTFVGDRPLPDGSQSVQWDVTDVKRQR